MNSDLLKTLEDFKRLPRKDRKAIERQLSGLDKLNVKKAVNAIGQNDNVLKLTDAQTDNVADAEPVDPDAPDLSGFSSWFAQELETRLNDGKNEDDEPMVSEKMAKLLPELIEAAQSSKASKTTIFVAEKDNRGTFKSIIHRLAKGDS